MILGCSDQKSEFGNAIITQFQPIYENEDDYFPHDFFITSDVLKKPVEIRNSKDSLTIVNIYNSGFDGHRVLIQLTLDLKLLDVKYDEWHDVEDGSNTKYKVEKIILTLSADPFMDSLLTGYYSLQIRHDYEAWSILGNEGVQDTTYYSVFNGKFKLYSNEEIKKGKEWVIDQNELKYGIKDSLGIYCDVDKFAKFQLGDSVLNEILANLQLNRTQVDENLKSFVTLSFKVDESGEIDMEKVRIREGLNSNEVLTRMKKNYGLTGFLQNSKGGK